MKIDSSIKKNSILKLDIIDMTKDGLGLAKVDGQVFFVKNAVLGDIVLAIITKITKDIIYAKVDKIIDKSDYRIEPICDVANACGGCQLMCLDIREQLRIKIKYVKQCLKKIGKFDDDNLKYDGISYDSDLRHFRNKMQVPFAEVNGKIIYGFYAGRTHHIVEFKKCSVGFEGSEYILEAIKDNLSKFSISLYDEDKHEGVFREVMLRISNVTKEVSITYILNDYKYNINLEKYKSFDKSVRQTVDDKLKKDNKEISDYFKIVTSTININVNKTNVLFGNENIVIYGNGYIIDNVSNIKFKISPVSFYQVNIKNSKYIYNKVLEYGEFTGRERVLDLYCGIGTISLYIARYVKEVLGIEIVEEAVKNARENASINNVLNSKFISADLSKLDYNDRNAENHIIKELKNIMNNDLRYDTIIVDPPRKGLDISTIEFIKRILPRKIIYVSCDPATLARDLDIICNKYNLYNFVSYSNVDMFPNTMHIETIVKLIRK